MFIHSIAYIAVPRQWLEPEGGVIVAYGTVTSILNVLDSATSFQREA